jgi:hypothetical protein
MLALLARPRASKPGHIIRYEVNGQRFIVIPKFLRHQKPYHRETPSDIPPPPSEIDPPSSPVTPEAGKSTAMAGIDPGHGRSDPDPVSGSCSLDPDPDPVAKEPAPPEASQPETAATWRSYSDAYRRRYGAAPLRNAKVNGQLAQFLKRVPRAQAPDVAAFYVEHNGAFYVRAGHPVGLLLQDAEKLHTECVTNRQITGVEAQQRERTQARVNVFTKYLEERGHVVTR